MPISLYTTDWEGITYVEEMGVIIHRIKLVGSKGEKKVDALFGSGASFSFITKALAQQLDVILQLPRLKLDVQVF